MGTVERLLSYRFDLNTSRGVGVCGIAGFICLDQQPHVQAGQVLTVMQTVLEHRGPDGVGRWVADDQSVGICHTRLAIIDLTSGGQQPMASPIGEIVAVNGEIYNHVELRSELASAGWAFRSRSDTEVLLASLHTHGPSAVDRLRGMFAYVYWDPRTRTLELTRDRLGIKPLYYCVSDRILYFASEAKALLPFLPSISTNEAALAEYLTFNYTLGDQTLFEGIRQVMPAESITVADGQLTKRTYWRPQERLNFDRSESEAVDRIRQAFHDSVSLHLRGDVEIGTYVSGGIDSSLVSALAADQAPGLVTKGFHGRFRGHPDYDESAFAHVAATSSGLDLRQIDIGPGDFLSSIDAIAYHLDFPVAGPGSFPQFVVSERAAREVKVVLGGQGGDEIFGGYARYLVAYLEQCLRAAVDGTSHSGEFVVTLESIIPNLGVLREYKPLIQKAWSGGLFDSLDRSFFRLIDRSQELAPVLDLGALDMLGAQERYLEMFNDVGTDGPTAYFDKMTAFETRTLLPALLHIEDRMSMAHGLESRVPFVDHELVDLVRSVPALIKFKGGEMKHLLKIAFEDMLPAAIMGRRDKMGFPVPLNDWARGPLAPYFSTMFNEMAETDRPFVRGREALARFSTSGSFSRQLWTLLSLELWYRQFHDQASTYRSLMAAR